MLTTTHCSWAADVRKVSPEEEKLKALNLERHFKKRHHTDKKDIIKAYESSGRIAARQKIEAFWGLAPENSWDRLNIPSEFLDGDKIDLKNMDHHINGNTWYFYSKDQMPEDIGKDTSLDKSTILVSRVEKEFFFQLTLNFDGELYHAPLAVAFLKNIKSGKPLKSVEEFIKDPQQFEVTSSKLYPGFFSGICNLMDLWTLELGTKGRDVNDIVFQIISFLEPFLEKDTRDSEHSYNTEVMDRDNTIENIVMAFSSDFLSLTVVFLSLFQQANGDENVKGTTVSPLFSMLPKHFKVAYKAWIDRGGIENLDENDHEGMKWLKEEIDKDPVFHP